MDNSPSSESHDQTTETAAPEVLKPRADDGTPAPDTALSSQFPAASGAGKAPRRRTYRPSHKATFIGLAVVIVILLVNAAILAFVLKGKTKTDQAASGQVTISSDVLNKLGVNNSSIGDSGVVLVVGPNAQFNGKVTVAGDVSIAGQLKLNSKFTASDASLTQLEAGNASLSQLNVNGASTLSSLNLRSGLVVSGATQLQGAVTISQLLTVDNNLTVTGNLAVGGVLSTKTFSATSLTSTSTLTIGGHVITGGSSPSVAPGSALGSNGTVSISGDDSAGTIAVNIGAGGGGGSNALLAKVAFHTQYGGAPRIIITPDGESGLFYVTSASASGFSINVNSGLSAGVSFNIDYIVEQ